VLKIVRFRTASAIPEPNLVHPDVNYYSLLRQRFNLEDCEC